ncbi:MAG: hypothetical protein CMB31_02845 [Euryarchaeota archaeon]|nr:hypothetical protein [Euryarchaeota archaeon]
MGRGFTALVLVSIMLLPGCIGTEDTEIIEDVEIEYTPPVPVVSISPSSPTSNDEITVTIQWYSVKGGSHPFTIYLDGNIVASGVTSGDLPTGKIINKTTQGEHTILVVVGENDNSKQTTWQFTTSPPPIISPDIFSPYYIQLENPGFSPIFSIEIEHPDIDDCSVISNVNGSPVDLEFSKIFGYLMKFEGIVEFTESTDLIIMADCGRNQISTKTIPVFVNDPALADTDEDGVLDSEDECDSTSGYTSTPNTDHDSDGCYDYTEDTDDDNDGKLDSEDRCIRGIINWDSSNTILDFDGDGCHDVLEDDDDDGDSILDEFDSCLSESFTSTGITDHDGDGCNDTVEDLDDDNDGFSDTIDGCKLGITNWISTNLTDYDSDGCRDIDEDTDDDSDSIPDVVDQCPFTTLGSLSVDLNGCDDDQRDSDGDGLVDSEDACRDTPIQYISQINEDGCADIDSDGVYSNVDSCPNSPTRWTIDEFGCAIIQNTVDWNTGPYQANAFGTAGDFSISTTTGTYSFSSSWTGENTHLFIFNYKSSSYMSNLWNQDVGQLLANSPDNVIIVFGSFDSDFASDISSMENRVQNWLSNQNQDVQNSWNGRILFMDQRASSSSGSLGDIINEWSTFYYGIDRFQRWRQIGNLLDWSQGNSCCYKFHYIGNEPKMWNAEFITQLRPLDPGITTVQVWSGERHQGGWGSGYSSYMNASLPDAITMEQFDTLEVHHEHRCTDRRDRYGIDDDGDGSADRYSGCHEWDRLQRMSLCDNTTTNSCGTEVVRYITTYGREGQWTTDISPYLFMFLDGGDRRFKYSGAEGGNLVITLMFSTWGEDDSRPVRGELAFNINNVKFNSNYNNESTHDRRHDVDSNSWHSVSIVAAITGHGFGVDPNNCAEFCNHEHRYSMNGYDVTEDHPMAGNSSVNSDREGCTKTTGEGTVANQFGSWPYGRAGWCAGQDVKLWIFDITHWINPTGTNELLYQGLFDGAQYQETSTNPYIVGTVWIVYEHNVTNQNSGVFKSDYSSVDNQGMITANPDMSNYASIRT